MKPKSNRSILLIIFLTVFIDMLGFGILIPVIPQLLANPRSEYFLLPAGMTLNDGYILLGFLTASFSLGQFIATPILGQLSDRFGRKPLLALSLAGTCLSYLIFAFGILFKSIPLLFAARILDGITGGNISVAQAAIADVTEPKDRAKNFGLIGAAFGLGFILGPYIGGKLSDPAIVSWFTAATPFWFAAGLCFLNVVSVVLFFPETVKQLKKDFNIQWSRSVLNIVHAAGMPGVRVIFLTVFLFFSGFTFFTTFFGIFLISKFNYTQGNIGDFFAYVGLWIAFTQAIITRRISSKFEDYKIIQLAIMVAGVAILGYFLPSEWWGLLLIVPFFAVSNGLYQANITGLVSKSAQPGRQGEVLGINSSVQALAQAIPPIISGYLAASLDPDTPILVSAIVITLAGFVFMLFYRPASVSHEAQTAPTVTSLDDVTPQPIETDVSAFEGPVVKQLSDTDTIEITELPAEQNKPEENLEPLEIQI